MRYLACWSGLILSLALAIPNAHAQAQQGVPAHPKPLNLHAQALPDHTPDTAAAKIAIEGYSPVSYFEKNIAEQGKPEFQARYDGKTYYFASAEQVRTFEADPKHYAPVFGEYCPYSLALGRRVAIDPTRFRIVDGQLLLFHRSAELDALTEWDKSKDKERILRRANSEYTLFRF